MYLKFYELSYEDYMLYLKEVRGDPYFFFYIVDCFIHSIMVLLLFDSDVSIESAEVKRSIDLDIRAIIRFKGFDDLINFLALWDTVDVPIFFQYVRAIFFSLKAMNGRSDSRIKYTLTSNTRHRAQLYLKTWRT